MTATTGAMASSYAYDAAGNTTSRTIGGVTQTLTWTPQGKLAQVTAGTTVLSRWVHAPDGSVLTRTDNGKGTTAFLPGLQVTKKPDGSFTATRSYGIAGRTIAERTTTSSTTTVLNAVVTDRQGTIRYTATWNDQVPVGSRRILDPYGAPLSDPTVTHPWPSPGGFLNEPTSTVTGLVDIGARVYDTTLGRFLSVDPLLDVGDPTSHNGYSYTNHDPINSSDPTGLQTGCADTCVEGAIDLRRVVERSTSQTSAGVTEAYNRFGGGYNGESAAGAVVRGRLPLGTSAPDPGPEPDARERPDKWQLWRDDRSRYEEQQRQTRGSMNPAPIVRVAGVCVDFSYSVVATAGMLQGCGLISAGGIGLAATVGVGVGSPGVSISGTLFGSGTPRIGNLAGHGFSAAGSVGEVGALTTSVGRTASSDTSSRIYGTGEVGVAFGLWGPWPFSADTYATETWTLCLGAGDPQC